MLKTRLPSGSVILPLSSVRDFQAAFYLRMSVVGDEQTVSGAIGVRDMAFDLDTGRVGSCDGLALYRYEPGASD